MARPMTPTDWTFLTVFVVALVLGVFAKVLWKVLDARDQRIRNIMGPHELGTSDPYDWTDETAFAAREGILQQHEMPSLLELAGRSLHDGDVAGAMLYTRLAMRCEPGPEAEALFAQVLGQAAG
jgi:hypothetical protein